MADADSTEGPREDENERVPPNADGSDQLPLDAHVAVHQSTTNSSLPNQEGRSSGGRAPDAREIAAHLLVRCQVDGCGADLSTERMYSRRHRICALHLASLCVQNNSSLQRFCQQCSRFHDVTAFEGERRSCRAALSQHNSRRRHKRAQSAARAGEPPQRLRLTSSGGEPTWALAHTIAHLDSGGGGEPPDSRPAASAGTTSGGDGSSGGGSSDPRNGAERRRSAAGPSLHGLAVAPGGDCAWMLSSLQGQISELMETMAGDGMRALRDHFGPVMRASIAADLAAGLLGALPMSRDAARARESSAGSGGGSAALPWYATAPLRLQGQATLEGLAPLLPALPVAAAPAQMQALLLQYQQAQRQPRPVLVSPGQGQGPRDGPQGVAGLAAAAAAALQVASSSGLPAPEPRSDLVDALLGRLGGEAHAPGGSGGATAAPGAERDACLSRLAVITSGSGAGGAGAGDGTAAPLLQLGAVRAGGAGARGNPPLAHLIALLQTGGGGRMEAAALEVVPVAGAVAPASGEGGSMAELVLQLQQLRQQQQQQQQPPPPPQPSLLLPPQLRLQGQQGEELVRAAVALLSNNSQQQQQAPQPLPQGRAEWEQWQGADAEDSKAAVSAGGGEGEPGAVAEQA